MKHPLILATLFAFFLSLGTVCAGIPPVLISLKYDGQADDLTRQVGVNSKPGYTVWEEIYRTSDDRLEIVVKTKRYEQFPVKEYSVSLKNLSKTEETKIISDFQSLDLNVPLSKPGAAVTLNTLRGSQCVAEDFTPIAVELATNKSHSFATASGRSSNEFMPFIELNQSENRGTLFAVGWTGHWAAKFHNDSDKVNVKIGMGKTNFKLKPGETLIQPSITIFERHGKTRREFKTLVHKFMLEHKVPRDEYGKIIPPVLAVACGGGNKTPQMMLDILQYVVDNKIPLDTYWIDAGWYGAPHEDELYSNCGPNWYKYVGDWRVNTTTHPSGTLLPIAEAVHKQNMRLLLWFEPERAHDGVPILQEHPEYFNNHLLDLGNPEAKKWIQDTVFNMIEKHGINIYRQDFNMDPGGIWAGLDNENPDRVGIAEAKHIAGLYEYMDAMRKRFPGILQENCASGGRRLDIEMLTRAHAYCRSDYFIGQKPGDTAFILGQNATLNTVPYLPFQGCEFNCVPVGDDYAAFSIISTGTVVTFSDFDGGIIRRKITPEETDWFKKVFDTANRMKEFYTGSFYQLSEETTPSDDSWCGWQFDRDDLNAGFALIFRRKEAPEQKKMFTLGNIDADAQYEIECFTSMKDAPEKKTVKGQYLQSLNSAIPQRSFALIFYKKKIE